MRSKVIGVLVCLVSVWLATGCTMVVDPNFQMESSGGQIAPEAATWGTWVLASADELRPAGPPGADVTMDEIAQLKELAAQRDASVQDLVTYWDAGSPSYRWIDIALDAYSNGPPGPRVSRPMALLNVALYDAMVATWDAKYEYDRARPVQVDPSIVPMIATPNSPSYPSEHAAAAGAAATVLAYLFPEDAERFAAMAEEAAQSRLLAGVHYPSDVEAGLALGRAVGERVVEWAKADGSDVVWTGTVPTGPGLWQGDNPVNPMAATWRTWVLTSPDQFRPPPPPAHDSEEVQAELAVIKSITRTFPLVQKATYWHSFESAYPFWYDWASRQLFEGSVSRSVEIQGAA